MQFHVSATTNKDFVSNYHSQKVSCCDKYKTFSQKHKLMLILLYEVFEQNNVCFYANTEALSS